MIAKCKCQHCSVNIEFDASQAGQAVPCPSCGMETQLYYNPAKARKTSGSTVRSVGFIGITILAFLVIGGFAYRLMTLKEPARTDATPTNQPVQQVVKTNPPAPPPVVLTEEEKIDTLKAKPFLLSAEEKTARENILKSMLDISSATQLGVTRGKFSDLLTAALSTLTFEKTKLTMDRHQKYLLCAEKAIDYYSKANEEWSSYFKYEWMRDKNETFISKFEIDDLKNNGVSLGTLRLKASKDDKNMFYIDFNSCLTLYWNAADVYIEKMKTDISL